MFKIIIMHRKFVTFKNLISDSAWRNFFLTNTAVRKALQLEITFSISVLKIAYCTAMETNYFSCSTFDRNINAILLSWMQHCTNLSSDLSFLTSCYPTNTLLIPRVFVMLIHTLKKPLEIQPSVIKFSYVNSLFLNLTN